VIIRFKSAVLLFMTSALVGAVLVNSAPANAVTWQTHSATGCVPIHESLTQGGTTTTIDHRVINGAAQNFHVQKDGGVSLLTVGEFECPISEDERHVKGGASTLNATVETYSANWQTFLFACVRFEQAVGTSCTAQTNAPKVNGTTTVTITPSLTNPNWLSGLNYPYLWVGIGARFGSTSDPIEKLYGYWTRTP